MSDTSARMKDLADAEELRHEARALRRKSQYAAAREEKDKAFKLLHEALALEQQARELEGRAGPRIAGISGC